MPTRGALAPMGEEEEDDEVEEKDDEEMEVEVGSVMEVFT